MAVIADVLDGVTNVRTLKLAHSAAVEANQIIISNGQILVAVNKKDAAQDNAFIYRSRLELPKETDLVVAVGDILYWDPSAEKAKKDKGMSAGTPDYTGTGNGTITGEAAGSNAIPETWILKCIATGIFSIIGSKTGRMDDANVDAAYDNGYILFIINGGGTAFVVGDKFTIVLTQGNTKIGMAVEASAASDTTVIGMLKENV